MVAATGSVDAKVGAVLDGEACTGFKVTTWLTFPSKKPVTEAQACIDLWRSRGYRIGIWRDTCDPPVERAEVQLTGDYPGYYAAVNAIIREILAVAADPEWIVAAGDDMDPDPTKTADEIAAECTTHFSGTFGVMQPTGDRWGSGARVYAEHICGSPWIGQDFARRMYGERGPYHEGYFHNFGDEEIMNVAVRLGVLWQRSDIAQYHHHWGREQRPMPRYLKRANDGFRSEQQIFLSRKARGFPGHEPLPA